MAGAATPRNFVAIQALRGLSALTVVTEHAMFYARERLDDATPVWDFGRLGVFIFFAISGFVMVVTNPPAAAARPGSWHHFAIRRAIRVVPTYWLATTVKVVALVAAPAAVLHAALNPGSVLASYVFVPTRNIDGKVEPTLGVGWTLLFEMAFYLLFTVALLIRINPTRWITAIVSVLALGYIVRPDFYPVWAFYFDPIALFFAVGMMLAAWFQVRNTRETIVGLLWISTLWFATYLFHRPDGAAPDVSRAVVDVLTMLCFCGIVLLEPLLALLVPRWLQRLADMSYSLYLVHPLIAPLAPAALAVVLSTTGLADRVPLWLLALVSVCGSLALAIPAGYLMYRWFETPVTRWLMGRVKSAIR